MADNIFDIEIITPDRVFYKGETDFLEFNTQNGEIGVYKNHIPLTTVLAPGIVTIHNGDEEKIAAIHSGFAEILGDKVTFLAELAEWPDEIDIDREFNTQNGEIGVYKNHRPRTGRKGAGRAAPFKSHSRD